MHRELMQGVSILPFMEIGGLDGGDAVLQL